MEELGVDIRAVKAHQQGAPSFHIRPVRKCQTPSASAKQTHTDSVVRNVNSYLPGLMSAQQPENDALEIIGASVVYSTREGKQLSQRQ